MAVLTVVIGMPPGLVATNRRDTVATRTTKDRRRVKVIRKSDAYRAAEDELIFAVRQRVALEGWRTLEGDCYVAVWTFWPGDKGDVDAANKAALDALKHGGAYVDDGQVVDEVLRRTWGALSPRIELAVTTTLDELLELLGWDG